MNERLLIEERALIHQHERDPERQSLLLTTSILIAAQSKLFGTDFLWDLFKEDPMDFDNPVIQKLFQRHYGEQIKQEVQRQTEKLEQQIAQREQAAAQKAIADAIQRVNEASQRELQRMQREVETAARREAEAEAARREAEAKTQWEQLMIKVLESRFQTMPASLFLVLQTITPAQRNPAADHILSAPDAQHCLQALRHLVQPAA